MRAPSEIPAAEAKKRPSSQPSANPKTASRQAILRCHDYLIARRMRPAHRWARPPAGLRVRPAGISPSALSISDERGLQGDVTRLHARGRLRPAFPDNLPRINVNNRKITVNGLYRHGFLLASALAELTLAYVQRNEVMQTSCDAAH